MTGKQGKKIIRGADSHAFPFSCVSGVDGIFPIQSKKVFDFSGSNDYNDYCTELVFRKGVRHRQGKGRTDTAKAERKAHRRFRCEGTWHQ